MNTILKFGIAAFAIFAPALAYADEEITMEKLMKNGLLTRRGNIYINGGELTSSRHAGKAAHHDRYGSPSSRRLPAPPGSTAPA